MAKIVFRVRRDAVARAIAREKRLSVRELEAAWVASTKEIAREMQLAIKESVSTPFPPSSKPNRLPHKRSGTFRSSISVTGGKALTIKSGVIYGGFLETGTVNMDPRPWAARQLQGALGDKWAKRMIQKMKRRMRGKRR
jgi:hypothetical protein